jgi:hypothetical protein
MFTEYICEDPWENRSHRRWTAIASFGLQTLVVIALMILPVLYTSGLPSLQFIARIVAPASPPPASSVTSRRARLVGLRRLTR